jgi:hypothetical protein
MSSLDILWRVNNKHERQNMWLFVVLSIIIYYINNNSFLIFIKSILKQQNINFTLHNGLLNFHPFIIYSVYGITTTTLYALYCSAVTKRVFILFNEQLKNGMSFVAVSMLLGSL